MVAIQDNATSGTIALHAIGEAATLGPWAITVIEVVAGDEAASMMSEANPENPAAPDGQAWLCARISAQNTSDVPRAIQMADFAGSGGDGILRRTGAFVIPEPMLQAVVEPGATAEGWIAITVADPATAILLYDSPLHGTIWTDALFALGEAATAPSLDGLTGGETDPGSDPASPVAIGETVTVDGWEVTITDAAFGGDMFEIFDFQTRALQANNEWIQAGAAVYATVRNLNAFPAFFSDVAFEVCDFNGEPWDHTLTLTVPVEADVSREYLPGASGEGWTAFGGWQFTEFNLLRVAPFKVSGGERFITFGGSPPPPGSDDEASAEATAEPADEPKGFAPGDIVVTTEDLVNLRAEPSASGDVLQEMPLGTELEVTGEPVSADGYTWYPVSVIEGGDAGYAVQDFLEVAD